MKELETPIHPSLSVVSDNEPAPTMNSDLLNETCDVPLSSTDILDIQNVIQNLKADSQEKEDAIDHSQLAAADELAYWMTLVGPYRLLNKNEETKLAKTLKRARNEISQITNNPEEQITESEEVVIQQKQLSPEEELHLELLKEVEKETRERLILHNTRLAISIAKRFRDKGLSFNELIQEANIGLFKAIDKFDPDLGFRVTTYATWWIRQTVSRAVMDSGSTIRIPVHMSEKITKVSLVENDLATKLGRPPSVEEVATYLNVSSEEIESIYEFRSLKYLSSLNHKVSDDKDSLELQDLLAGKDEPLGDEAEDLLFRESVSELLDILTPREREIVSLRYGINSTPHTLQEVGKILNLSRERIRQIEFKAIRKLRPVARQKKMNDYLE